MAQEIFNARCNDKYLADSAGISTSEGKPVSQNSVLALREIGIETAHTSQLISETLVKEFDYIVGITQNHANVLKNAFPEYQDKIYSFPVDISDPYGMSLSEYVKCREKISEGITLILNELN